MNRHNKSDKPDWIPPRSARLLDQVRERVRYLHYSLQTEKAYVYWTKAFVLWAARSHGGFQHLRDMGQTEVEVFLTMLTTEKQVAPATHRQALNALLFLYLPPTRAQAYFGGVDGAGGSGAAFADDGHRGAVGCLALRQWTALARGAGLAGQGCGFRPPRDHCAQRQG